MLGGAGTLKLSGTRCGSGQITTGIDLVAQPVKFIASSTSCSLSHLRTSDLSTINLLSFAFLSLVSPSHSLALSLSSGLVCGALLGAAVVESLLTVEQHAAHDGDGDNGTEDELLGAEHHSPFGVKIFWATLAVP